VTVIDSSLKVAFETLVRPSNRVIDYNTKFSGIKEGDLDSVSTTLEDVQESLLNIINSQTILIGHSLENDLKALKIVHERVIDTAVLFPHRRGLPYKRSLKNLMAEFLKSIIQDEGNLIS
jgi:RNA exonuclease 1 homolog